LELKSQNKIASSSEDFQYREIDQTITSFEFLPSNGPNNAKKREIKTIRARTLTPITFSNNDMDFLKGERDGKKHNLLREQQREGDTI
jgi:hypothetical protein